MNRGEALALLDERIAEPSLRSHMLATEAVLRSLAARFGQDPELWGFAGLVHDLDYNETVSDFPRHGFVTAQMLAGKGVPQEVLDAVVSHAGHRERTTLLDKALYAADPVTGLITAAALVRPEKKLALVEVRSLKKRFREKQFARGADREQIMTCQDLGMELDEFLALSLEAMKGVAEQIGL